MYSNLCNARISHATGFSRAFACFLSGSQGFSSKRHSERFSSFGLPMRTPDETWGVNSLTIAVVCESWLWQSRSSRRAEPCQDGRRNSRGVFWKGSCRRSSELYSYEKSVLSRFGPHRLRLGGEGPPRDFDLLSRRRHRFFSLRRKSASFADLEKSCEFVFHNFSFFICWAIRHPSFSADGGWLFSVIVVSECKIQMFLSRTTGHERLESEGRGEMPYGLWRLLSQRKKTCGSDRSCVS